MLKDSIFIKDKNRLHRIKFGDVVYFKSEHVYTKFTLNSGKSYMVRINMSDVPTLHEDFVRIHRSYGININYIDSIGNSDVIIMGKSMPIGLSFKKDLFSKIIIK